MLLNEQYNTDLTVESGYLLVSEPFLPDPNFERSVVLLCEHQPDVGSFGFVVNRPTSVLVNEVLEANDLTNTLYVGGPVEQNTLHFVHLFAQIEGAIPLKDGLFWGGNFEQLLNLAELGMVTNDNCRFFMGYSGWGKQQLQTELEQNAWIIAKPNLQLIFQVQPDQLWREILKNMGGKFKVFANFPTDPRLN